MENSFLHFASYFPDTAAFVVRATAFDESSNLFGHELLWPEVLICKDKASANRLCDQLNKASFDEDFIASKLEEPDLSRNEAYRRWLAEKSTVYIVENPPSLRDYEHLHRVPDSEFVFKNVIAVKLR